MVEETSWKKDLLPIIVMGCFFILIHGLALAVTEPFEEAELQMFEEKNDPVNIVQIFVILLLMTGLILLIAKYWKKQFIKLIVVGAIGYTSAIVFMPLFKLVFPASLGISIPVSESMILLVSYSILLSIASALLLIFLVYKYPEWYVIDVAGVIVGAGAIAIFGISLGVLLVLVLLIALAVYDAISVYKTKHMIDLADTVMDLKLPVLLVVPKKKSYSLIKDTKQLKQKLKDDEERDAFFMGLGDVVMPGILVVAAYQSIPNGLPIALSVLAGTLLGFCILMSFVIKGKPQAGLPALCGGAIAGYVISSLLLYGNLVGI